MFLTCSSFYYLQTVDERYYFYYSFLNCQRKDIKLTTTEHWVFQWGICSKPGQEQLCTWHVCGWPEMWNEAQSLLSVRELVQHAPVGLRGVENTPLSQLDAPSLRWVRCLVLLQDETGWDSHPFRAWKCWNVSEYTGKKNWLLQPEHFVHETQPSPRRARASHLLSRSLVQDGMVHVLVSPTRWQATSDDGEGHQRATLPRAVLQQGSLTIRGVPA